LRPGKLASGYELVEKSIPKKISDRPLLKSLKTGAKARAATRIHPVIELAENQN
jgi:hypothetical protein